MPCGQPDSGAGAAPARFVLGVDVGSTTVKCHVYDRAAAVRGSSCRKVESLCPRPGWVELDPEVLWSQFVGVIKEAVQSSVYATDYSNASSTGIFEPFTKCWSPTLCNLLSLPVSIYPPVKDTSFNFGSADSEIFGVPIPIMALVSVDDTYLCASFLGLKPSTTRNHLVRAILESVAFRADGGVSNNSFVMQMTSDLINKKIEKPANADMSSLGAAFLAGLASASSVVSKGISAKIKEQESRGNKDLQVVIKVKGKVLEVEVLPPPPHHHVSPMCLAETTGDEQQQGAKKRVIDLSSDLNTSWGGLQGELGVQEVLQLANDSKGLTTNREDLLSPGDSTAYSMEQETPKGHDSLLGNGLQGTFTPRMPDQVEFE
ncbi:hypothetical protein BTVI_154331 [Pitangus sulphuratus]|nr:hypothetical protein BTVI_154331 [Pitangus sulphuratus]